MLDAADYITGLPKKETDLPDRQSQSRRRCWCPAAVPTMLAQIAVMKALNRHVERLFDPERKVTHR